MLHLAWWKISHQAIVAMATTEAQIGEAAPEFELPDQQGQLWRLRDQRGKVVVLLFYPGDETPVCTKQLCSVRDNWERYRATGAEVVGLNSDSSEKHQRFAAHHQLPLRLLADTTGAVVRAYGMKNFLGTKRGVVVIDRDGVVRYRRTVLPVFRPTDDEVLGAIKAVTDS
jgi:thioredoxin-dependent peroxiredoxin